MKKSITQIRNNHRWLLLGAASALFATAAFAQNPPTIVSQSTAPPAATRSDDEPVPTSVAPPDTPMDEPTPAAVAPTAAPRAAQAAQSGSEGDSGTTIVGDKEAPIGLFITPWKDEYAEHGLDRPARFVDVDTSPIDPDTFQRRINYYNVITEYRDSHLASGK